jgi:hypothetical protein
MVEMTFLSIAAALANQTVTGLYKLVKQKFLDNPVAAAVLEAVRNGAEDPTAITKLGKEIEDAQTQDPLFAQGLQKEWQQISIGQRAEYGSVANQISGNVSGNVVQARDIQGGISF